MASAPEMRSGDPSLRSPGVCWFDAGIALVLFLVAVAYFSLTFTRGLELRDEGYLLHQSARVAAGEVPHRDILDVYGPGVFAIGAQVIRLFGRDIVPIRALLALFKGGAVVLTFLIARFYATRPFAIIGALLAVAYWGRVSWNLNTPYAALYTVPLCLLALLMLLRALQRRSRLGYFLAGLFVGSAVLFKQSLAIACAYGMVLALWGEGMLRERPGRHPSLETPLSLSLWFVAGLAPVIPFLSLMNWMNYSLHFLPLHFLMVLVASGVVRRRTVGSAATILKKRLLPFTLGFGIFPCATALVYASWGALGKLILDMFVPVQTLTNYYVPVNFPPFIFLLILGAVISLISMVLLILRGRPRSAFCFAVAAFVGALAVHHLSPPTEKDPYLFSLFMYTPFACEEGLLTIISIAALCVFAPSIYRPERAGSFGDIGIVLPLILFHMMLTFQVFPRATFNYRIVQGALMPLLTLVLFAWYRLGVTGRTGMGRRAIAAACVFILPFWLVDPFVEETIAPARGKVVFRPVDLPWMEKIRVTEGEYRFLGIGDLEGLIAYLKNDTSQDAPLFLLTNQEMILYLSGRETLFPDREFYLFLLGWGMYPKDRIHELDEKGMIGRLRERPDAILIDRDDEQSARLHAMMPELSAVIDRDYDVEARIGLYSILRRKAGSAPDGEGSGHGQKVEKR